MFSSVCKGHTVRAKMEAVVSRENPKKQTPWQRKRILLKTQYCGQGVKALTTKNVLYFIYINHIKSSKNTPGSTPLCKSDTGFLQPQRVWFLRRFGLKTSIDFAHFGLELGMVFEETIGVYEPIYRFSSKWYANSEWILRNLFGWRPYLSNWDIISWRPGLKTGGKLWHFLVWIGVRIWRSVRHSPTKNSQEYLPGKIPNTSVMI